MTKSIDWRQSDEAAKNDTGMDVVATLKKNKKTTGSRENDARLEKTDVRGGKSGRS